MPNAGGAGPTSRIAVQQIMAMVSDGTFPRGARLPPQRELAAQLQVSRPSLREALSVLETLGVLRTEAGQGTFVAEPGGERPKEPWRPKGGYSLQEVYQFRFVAEGYAAYLAAMRSGEAELTTLRKVLTEHQEAIRREDVVSASQHDFEFHRLIMVFSGNSVFVDLHASFRKVLLESQFLPASRLDRAWEVIVEHENILRTLQHRDPNGASYFMHVHITRAADRVGVKLNDVL